MVFILENLVFKSGHPRMRFSQVIIYSMKQKYGKDAATAQQIIFLAKQISGANIGNAVRRQIFVYPIKSSEVLKHSTDVLIQLKLFSLATSALHPIRKRIASCSMLNFVYTDGNGLSILTIRESREQSYTLFKR